MEHIKQNVRRLFTELPEGVQLLAAAKARRPEEVLAAVDAGISIIGENYLQEAEAAFSLVGKNTKWHFIGHLQKNKVKKAVILFDMIETVDSLEIASEINRRCAQIGKIMPVLIEVNSGREEQKAGVLPEKVEGLIKAISSFKNIKVSGLMTMGPYSEQAEDLRPYFKATRKLFEDIKESKLPNVTMQYLSMGMTDSYQVALEEGANIIRIGSAIFGPRYF
jgi:pyridoxal phosphate enzyme (YggS family)